MSIQGLNINLKVGAFTVNRLPYGELKSERGAVAERLVLNLPDPEGHLVQELAQGDSVDLFFGYRCGPEQSWQGKISKIQTKKDQVIVTALSREHVFIETKISECFFQESCKQVVARLMKLAGVSPGRLDGPDELMPHLIFSGQPVWDCFRRINETLSRVYEHDMRAHVYWIDENGFGNWGDFDAAGPIPIFASCDNLVNHNPKNKDEGEIVGILFPGISHSRLVTVRDGRRGQSLTKRALSVRHILGDQGYLTFITYGKEKGYA